ncbi:N-acetylneuraminate synthase family protein [Pedobacter sp. BAL39]|uniref:N-acetylneuraminate synthase family protein n=1 Tax=Pedobacter sp. BAL39 TaxID=391596 RepID=UPI0005871AE9|nr:N-acetylneuraminate synthase family protein [Pedobacter sp. BAL39]
MNTIKFGTRTIGQGHPLYFVADIGANHDGDLQKALDLIEMAKEAGADAAKFQHFQASKIVSRVGFDSLGGQLSHQASWKKSVYEVYEDASINQDWTPILKKRCDEIGIDFFTSPYDFKSVDDVDQYVDLYKVGSGDITWIEIIKYIANKNKPVLIATGASDMPDVERAMNAIQPLTKDIVLMQCNTNYTVEKDKHKYSNLNVLKTFSTKYPDTILGLSDHTFSHSTVLGAVALGALVFEKHFTNSNDQDGPDHKFAVNPAAWREMVDRANELYEALGDGIKRVEENELQSAIVQRRSLRLTSDLPAGHTLSAGDLEPLRPITSDGLEPYKIDEVIGHVLKENLKQGAEITLNHI